MTRSVACLLLCFATIAAVSAPAAAQDPPPRIGPFVVDVRGTFPKFTSSQQLADSRALATSELPGVGLGLDVGAHVYVLTWKAVTVGLGGQLTVARSRFTPPGQNQAGLRAVTERFTSIAPQLSLNFGDGNGWSYLSGGLGPSTWSIVPDGAASSPADQERLRTLNYGGGARWFVKRRLAFTLDVRFYAIDPGTPQPGHAGSPRTTMLIMGAGLSVK